VGVSDGVALGDAVGVAEGVADGVALGEAVGVAHDEHGILALSLPPMASQVVRFKI
jgi:hypothetical protein